MSMPLLLLGTVRVMIVPLGVIMRRLITMSSILP